MKYLFTKYRKKKDESKVLLMYLLLNGNDTEKIKVVEEKEDEKRKVIYGITSEAVNGRQFEQEIENILAPTVCSPQSYELYSDSKLIHIYTPDSDDDLFINDLGIISQTMVIAENCVVSSNLVKSTEDAEKYGFMYFYHYVLDGEMRLENWHVVYDKGLFQIFYYDIKDTQKKEFLLFSSQEIDKTSTYKFVLYIISKMQDKIMENVAQDNFKMTDYELIGGE